MNGLATWIIKENLKSQKLLQWKIDATLALVHTEPWPSFLEIAFVSTISASP